MARRPNRLDGRFSEGAVNEIDLLVSHADELDRIIDLSKSQTVSSQPNDAISAISKEVNISPSDLMRIFNALENFRSLQDNLGSLDKAIEGIKPALSPEIAAKLDAASPLLIRMVHNYDKDNPVSVSFKARRLTYLRERLFHKAEVVTDARPIFDASGQEIIEFIITHELVLTILCNNEFTTEHISIDNADILKLRAACDRAIIKAKTLKLALQEKWKTEVLRDDSTLSE